MNVRRYELKDWADKAFLMTEEQVRFLKIKDANKPWKQKR